MSQEDDLSLIWPSASRIGPYSPLGPSEIRLVDIFPGRFDDPIQIAIHPVDLKDIRTYDALSYVWNPKDGTIDEATPLESATVQNWDDFSIQLGANLGLAIRYLRKEVGTRTMWIDAISIDQLNILERNHQVRLMALIFAVAAEVRIWLGPPHFDSNLALTTLWTPPQIEERDEVVLVATLEWLLRRSWFGRLWVAQEVALSCKEPIIHCGYNVTDFNSFVQGVWRIKKNPDRWRSLSPELADRAHEFQRLVRMRQYRLKVSFTDIILWSNHLQASDPRDKVFGILGICNSNPVEPDYTKSVEQVYAEATAQIMRENLDVYVTYSLWRYSLWVRTQPRCLSDTASSRSWAPDLENPRLQGFFKDSRVDISLLQHSQKELSKYPPAIEFLDSFSLLFTAGQSMGRVVGAGLLLDVLNATISRESNQVLHTIKHLAGGLEAEKLCAALFRLTRPPSLSREALMEVITEVLQDTASTTLTELSASPKYHSFMEPMEQSLHGMQVFVTDKGFVGLIDSEADLGQCVLVGLFGANVPFLLQQLNNEDGGREETIYAMIDSAVILGHEYGNEHIEDPSVDWKGLVRSKKVEGFKIF